MVVKPPWLPGLPFANTYRPGAIFRSSDLEFFRHICMSRFPIIQLFGNTGFNNKVVLHAPVESNVAKKVTLENIILIENRRVKLAEGRL
jgi:hypothetical protein